MTTTSPHAPQVLSSKSSRVRFNHECAFAHPITDPRAYYCHRKRIFGMQQLAQSFLGIEEKPQGSTEYLLALTVQSVHQSPVFLLHPLLFYAFFLLCFCSNTSTSSLVFEISLFDYYCFSGSAASHLARIEARHVLFEIRCYSRAS